MSHMCGWSKTLSDSPFKFAVSRLLCGQNALHGNTCGNDFQMKNPRVFLGYTLSVVDTWGKVFKNSSGGGVALNPSTITHTQENKSLIESRFRYKIEDMKIILIGRGIFVLVRYIIWMTFSWLLTILMSHASDGSANTYARKESWPDGNGWCRAMLIDCQISSMK